MIQNEFLVGLTVWWKIFDKWTILTNNSEYYSLTKATKKTNKILSLFKFFIFFISLSGITHNIHFEKNYLNGIVTVDCQNSEAAGVL
jgi:hypothetical protein